MSHTLELWIHNMTLRWDKKGGTAGLVLGLSIASILKSMESFYYSNKGFGNKLFQTWTPVMKKLCTREKINYEIFYVITKAWNQNEIFRLTKVSSFQTKCQNVKRKHVSNLMLDVDWNFFKNDFIYKINCVNKFYFTLQQMFITL